MTNPPSFQDRITEAANAANTVQELETLLLSRFAALTQQGKVQDRRGRTLEPITEDIHGRTDGGYGWWGMSKWWDRALDAVHVDSDSLTFVHHLAGDHGVPATTTEYEVPWALLAADPTSNETYQQYLRLKAIFEPTQE